MPKILLVNPPIYDFAAFDYGIKPLGMLSAAAPLSNNADFLLFDYLDRLHPFYDGRPEHQSNTFGWGKFYNKQIKKPSAFKNIPRRFKRYGLPQSIFTDFLNNNNTIDFALIATAMTYWYPAYAETIADIRKHSPKTKIIIAGPYPAICPDHAKTLNADLTLTSIDNAPLYDFLNIDPDPDTLPPWHLYPKLTNAAIKITQGCPYKCTYCSVPNIYPNFKPRDINKAIEELKLLKSLGVRDINFFDDALLYKTDEILDPFLQKVINNKFNLNFHTPNALNARFVTPNIAKLMVNAGFKTFHLGFESASVKWQKQTGAKVYSDELENAVKCLHNAGADKQNITAYQILGHPDNETQDIETSIRFVHSLGIKGMLAEFSPIPGTPDGQKCRKFTNLDEPLNHNNTAFTITRLGFDHSNHLKQLQRKLNTCI